MKKLKRFSRLEDNKSGEGMFNQLLILIFVVVVIILAFFVFYKIVNVNDIILSLFG